MSLVNRYRDAFREGYKPALLTQGQTGAFAEQAANQNLATTLGRRGLSGSGIDFALQNANAAGRSASYNQALRDYYNNAESAARGAAEQTVGRETGTSVQTAVPYYPGPDYGRMATDVAGDISAGYGAYQVGRNMNRASVRPPSNAVQSYANPGQYADFYSYYQALGGGRQ